MGNHTIFDDVFRTMLEKMPELVIPLINEVFGTEYPEDIPIIQKRNEHETKSGEIITDSHLFIGNRVYHIECQSISDPTMVIRMIEYDFATALEYAQRENGKVRIYFPHSCVLYLRGKYGADILEMEIVMPDGSLVDYHVPIIRMEQYTRDVIFRKKLLFLLPFYVIRYEKQKKELEENTEKLDSLLSEYRLIEKHLEEELLDKGKEKEYRDLIELIIRIADYIFEDSEKARKGVGDVMGGNVLELESDRLIQRGYEQGIERGIEQGIQQGVTRGEEQQALKIARLMLIDGKLSLEEISRFSGLEPERIIRLKKEAKL